MWGGNLSVCDGWLVTVGWGRTLPHAARKLSATRAEASDGAGGQRSVSSSLRRRPSCSRSLSLDEGGTGILHCHSLSFISD